MSKNEDEQFISNVDVLMSPQEVGYGATGPNIQDARRASGGCCKRIF